MVNNEFKRIWVTGDKHGNFDLLPMWCDGNNTKRDEDLLIILGDAGINYYSQESEITRRIKERIFQEKITLLCVRGNHEERPSNLSNYSLQDVGIGDKVYVEDYYPNVWFAQDGGEYNICGKSFLTIGGAYSVDKPIRLLRGWRWFHDEMLLSDERKDILDKVTGKQYDHVLTHTCPFEWQPYYLFLDGVDQDKIPKDMEWFLSAVRNAIKYGHWWFGHFHDDVLNVHGEDNVSMLYHLKERIV